MKALLKNSFLPLVASMVLVPLGAAQVSVAFTGTAPLASPITTETAGKWYTPVFSGFTPYTAPSSFAYSATAVGGVSPVLNETISGTYSSTGTNLVGYSYDTPTTGTTLTVTTSLYLPANTKSRYAGIWGALAPTPGAGIGAQTETPLLEFEGTVSPVNQAAQTPGFYGYEPATNNVAPVVGLPASDYTNGGWFGLTINISYGLGTEYIVTDASGNVATLWVPFSGTYTSSPTIQNVTLMGYIPTTSASYTVSWAGLSFNGLGGGYSNTLPSNGVCNGVYTGSFTGTVTVAKGALCILDKATINGGINQTGGALLVEGGSTVSQSLNSYGGVASAIGSTLQAGFWIQGIPAGAPSDWFCGDTFDANATYILSGNGIVLGNQPGAPSKLPAGTPVCAGNNLNNGADVNFQANSGSDYIDGNSITGSVLDSGNNGYVEISNNAVGTGGVGVGNITGTAGVNIFYNTISGGGLYLNYVSGPLTVTGNLITGPAQFLNVSGTTSFSSDATVGNVNISGLTGGLTVNGYAVKGNVTITGNSGGVTVENLLAEGTGSETLTVSSNTGTVSVESNGSSTYPWSTINVSSNNITTGTTLTVTGNVASSLLSVTNNALPNNTSAIVNGNTAPTITLSGNHVFNVNGNGGLFYNCSGSFIGAQAPFCLNWLFYWLYAILGI